MQFQREIYKKMIANVNALYKTYNIILYTDTIKFVSYLFNGNSKCLPAYSKDNMEWWYALRNFKTAYSVNPTQVLNIFVSCQTNSQTQGSLLGIATFPWDAEATTKTGGLWMNSVAMGTDQSTLEHEIGHCLGLWHTFHGVTEVKECSICYELPHPVQLAASDRSNGIGDFTGDTLSTPKNYYCAVPPGQSNCDATKFSMYKVDYQNIMGYARYVTNTTIKEKCRILFTDLQKKRMHCYIRSSILSGWVCPNGKC